MTQRRIELDTSKLRGRIIEKFRTLGAFAAAMEMSSGTIGKKLDGRRYWDQREIVKACWLLEIEPDEIPAYFFADKVKNS